MVSVSSSQSHAIWCFHDIGYSLFTSPAFCNFESDYACYFHSVAVGSWLRFCREVLYRHLGGQRISLVDLLGEFVLATFLFKCLHLGFVPDPQWACHSVRKEHERENLSILDEEIYVLYHNTSFSPLAMWSDAFCWPRWVERSLLFTCPGCFYYSSWILKRWLQSSFHYWMKHCFNQTCRLSGKFSPGDDKFEVSGSRMIMFLFTCKLYVSLGASWRFQAYGWNTTLICAYQGILALYH